MTRSSDSLMRFLRRLVWPVLTGTATILLTLVANFFLFRFAPGDAADLRHIPGASAEMKEAIRREFGLDRPYWEQFVKYLEQLLHGNLGYSYQSRLPVSLELGNALQNTIPLLLIGLVVALVIAWFSAVIAAWNQGRTIDQVLRGAALAFYAMPTQWLGLILIFAFTGILPSGGMRDPFLFSDSAWDQAMDIGRHMILPGITYALAVYGQFMVIMRTSILQTLSEDFIVTAKIKGLTDWQVMQRHATRNALLPVTTLLGLNLGMLVGGAILIEVAYSWPGIGQLVYHAVIGRDYPVLSGAFILITTSVVVCNILVDMIYVLIDPRTRQS